jgi:DNA-directed RNA polymerase specialized sigma24 family protein
MDSMDEHEWLAAQFEANRTHLQAVAYRMLGSLAEADNAVQESWFRLSRLCPLLRLVTAYVAVPQSEQIKDLW